MIVVIVVHMMRFITTGILCSQGAENDISVLYQYYNTGWKLSIPINISINTGTQIKDLLALLLKYDIIQIKNTNIYCCI